MPNRNPATSKSGTTATKAPSAAARGGNRCRNGRYSAAPNTACERIVGIKRSTFFLEEILGARVQNVHAGPEHVAVRRIRQRRCIGLGVGACPCAPKLGRVAKPSSQQCGLCPAIAVGRNRGAEPEPCSFAANEHRRPG